MREESLKPSRIERDTYLRQETRDSLEIRESYCHRNNTGRSQIPKESGLTYWRQPHFREKDEGEIQKASKDDKEIQDIKRNLDEGKKEMKKSTSAKCKNHSWSTKGGHGPPGPPGPP